VEVAVFHEPAERRKIIELGKALQDAWNRGDAAGYASLFTDDADFVAWNGTYGRGRQAIEDGHRPLFDGPLAGSRIVLVDDDAESAPPESLRFVRPDVAIMVISGEVTLASQRATGPDHESVQTFVLTKNGGRWGVAAFHNTRRPAPLRARSVVGHVRPQWAALGDPRVREPQRASVSRMRRITACDGALSTAVYDQISGRPTPSNATPSAARAASVAYP
jgi:uncharacterized protein (TIGR02246 family)